ncbi:MAG: nucleotidyltransferase family protein [Ignavibacteria bacterium]|jgi:NDP-sugar pyrophosphorylase family protein
MKAMILAAGLGTRLKPITDNIPKALVKLNNKPLLDIIIEKLKASGFNDIIINVHHFADKIIDYIELNENFGIDITISDERDCLLDTGGGIKKASWFFDDGKPFLVHNVDIISKIDLNELYKYNIETNAAITLAVNKRESDRYLLFDKSNELTAWENKITGERKDVKKRNTENGEPKSERFYGYCGIKIMHPKVFKYFPKEKIFSIIDFYLKTASLELVNCFKNNSEWIDVGTKEKLISASKII